MSDQQDKIHIRKVLEGDISAYTYLVDKYRNLTLTLAYQVLMNREDAEEIAQDAFVKAFTALHTFKGEARFSTWLYSIVLNRAINKSKKKKLNMISFENDHAAQWLTVETAAMDSQLNNYKTEEQRKFIHQAMLLLGESERLVLTLYYLHEHSIVEVSELLALSKSNVKVLLHRGRKKFYENLQKILKEEVRNLI